MRIVSLSNDTKQSILDDLLKRSPNNYTQYEATVNEIIEREPLSDSSTKIWGE